MFVYVCAGARILLLRTLKRVRRVMNRCVGRYSECRTTARVADIKYNDAVHRGERSISVDFVRPYACVVDCRVSNIR
jgi:hypothetical protein